MMAAVDLATAAGAPTDRGRGGRARRVGGRRGAGRRRGRLVGAVRQPLPRERGARAAAAAPPAGQRTPLWQMRQRSAQLLAVASRYGTFPIILETYRECLQDVFDLPALRGVLAAIERREIRIVSVETRRASPFASSLLFDYIAAYMYEGDAPLVDRRAQALALDRDLLRELLGAEELRELLDARRPGRARAGAPGADPGARRGLGRPGPRPAAPPGRPVAPTRSPTRVRGADERRGAGPRGSGWGHLAADRRAVDVRITGEDALDRDGGRGALPGRGRRRAAAGRAGGVPGARRGCPWRLAVALGAASRAVPGRGTGRALGIAAGRRRDRPGAAAGGRRAGARRVPARRRGTRVVRPGGAAAAPPPLAGPAAPRGGARRAARARPLPARVAGRRQRRSAAPTGCPRSSPSWKGWRCPRASWSATSCRHASRRMAAAAGRAAGVG